jgi:hypothetical protein
MVNIQKKQGKWQGSIPYFQQSVVQMAFGKTMVFETGERVKEAIFKLFQGRHSYS